MTRSSTHSQIKLEREPKNIEEAYDRPIFDVGENEEQSKGRGRQLRQRNDCRDVDHAVNDEIDKLRAYYGATPACWTSSVLDH